MSTNGARRRAQHTGARTPRPGRLTPASQVQGAQRAVVLLELSEHGPLSMTALADRCRLDRDVVAEHLADLTRAGYARTDGPTWTAVPLLERDRARSEHLAAQARHPLRGPR